VLPLVTLISMKLVVLNCYIVDSLGLVDLLLINSDDKFIPSNFNSIVNFFFESTFLHSKPSNKLYHSQQYSFS